MANDVVPFLHAAHEVRETFVALQWASWLVIGLGIGAIVLSWGRIVAWVRSPEVRGPRVRRWGIAEGEMYFEVSPGAAAGWSAVGPDGQSVALERRDDGLLRAPALEWQPVALLSSEGARLPL